MTELYPWDPRENLKTADDMASYLDTILVHEGHWGGVYALSDIADAMGKRVAPREWRDEKSVIEAEKRADVLDFAAFMDMARALGIRLYAGAASCGESESVANYNGGGADGAAKTCRWLTQSSNGMSAEDMAIHLNAALDP